jgi:hypothetical protein
VNIAKVEYRGHGIHGNTPVGFTVLIFRMRDKKIKQRSITEVSRFQTEDRENWQNEPPTQLTLHLLTACAQVDTCLPGAACIPFLHTLELHVLPLPGLRIKNMSFTQLWNNNKLLFSRT